MVLLECGGSVSPSLHERNGGTTSWESCSAVWWPYLTLLVLKAEDMMPVGGNGDDAAVHRERMPPA